jgi:hypothetical protein
MNKVDIDLLLGTYNETKDEKIKRLEKENLALQTKVDTLTHFIKKMLCDDLSAEGKNEPAAFN